MTLNFVNYTYCPDLFNAPSNSIYYFNSFEDHECTNSFDRSKKDPAFCGIYYNKVNSYHDSYNLFEAGVSQTKTQRCESEKSNNQNNQFLTSFDPKIYKYLCFAYKGELISNRKINQEASSTVSKVTEELFNGFSYLQADFSYLNQNNEEKSAENIIFTTTGLIRKIKNFWAWQCLDLTENFDTIIASQARNFESQKIGTSHSQTLLPNLVNDDFLPDNGGKHHKITKLKLAVKSNTNFEIDQIIISSTKPEGVQQDIKQRKTYRIRQDIVEGEVEKNENKQELESELAIQEQNQRNQEHEIDRDRKNYFPFSINETENNIANAVLGDKLNQNKKFSSDNKREQKPLVSQEFLIKRSEENMPPMTTILPELPDYYDGQDYADYDTFLTHDENKNSILDNSVNNDYYSNLNPNKIQKTDRDRLTPLYGSPNDELPADSTDMNSNANNNNNSRNQKAMVATIVAFESIGIVVGLLLTIYLIYKILKSYSLVPKFILKFFDDTQNNNNNNNNSNKRKKTKSSKYNFTDLIHNTGTIRMKTMTKFPKHLKKYLSKFIHPQAKQDIFDCRNNFCDTYQNFEDESSIPDLAEIRTTHFDREGIEDMASVSNVKTGDI